MEEEQLKKYLTSNRAYILITTHLQQHKISEPALYQQYCQLGRKGCFALLYSSIAEADNHQPCRGMVWFPPKKAVKLVKKSTTYTQTEIDAFFTRKHGCSPILVIIFGFAQLPTTRQQYTQKTLHVSLMLRLGDVRHVALKKNANIKNWAERHPTGGVKSFRRTMGTQLSDHILKDECINLDEIIVKAALDDTGCNDDLFWWRIFPDSSCGIPAVPELERLAKQETNTLEKRLRASEEAPNASVPEERRRAFEALVEKYVCAVLQSFPNTEAYVKALHASPRFTQENRRFQQMKNVSKQIHTRVGQAQQLSKCAWCAVFLDHPRYCAQCKCVSYCGKEHQKLHWKAEHKQCCQEKKHTHTRHFENLK